MWAPAQEPEDHNDIRESILRLYSERKMAAQLPVRSGCGEEEVDKDRQDKGERGGSTVSQTRIMLDTRIGYPLW
jgi:hypothetical protein